jgi:hypothetical protein
MSLLIVGSCSRVTQNIILAASKQNLYKKITVADLLPTYDFHRRYYRLRRQLSDQKSQSEVVLDKIIKADHLYHQIQGHDHVLSVTHDYFHSTTSKTKLMELTADFAKQVSIVKCRRKDLFSQRLSNTTITGSKIQNSTTSTVSKELEKKCHQQHL